MRPRLFSPSFIVALLALVVAAGGMSYAAGRTGGQAGHDTVQSAVVRLACPAGDRKTFGLCMRKAASGPVSLKKARSTCDSQGGTLPSLGQLAYIAHLKTITWANGQSNQYEFTSTNTTAGADTPVARDQAGNLFSDATGQHFWYHCLTMPTPK